MFGNLRDAIEMPPSFDSKKFALAAYLVVALTFLVGVSSLMPAKANPRPLQFEIWSPPVIPPLKLTRVYLAPATKYGSGHRGIDLETSEGAVLMAPASGTVVFSGLVAIKPVVVLSHSATLKSTFEPACSDLPVGSSVQAGQVFGQVCSASYPSHCAPLLCLHFAAKTTDGYLSPEFLMGRLAPSHLIG